jgi:DNA-binding NarL/FixJ family response regulator
MALLRSREPSASPRLTQRERETLDFLVQGCTNGEIAEMLHLSPLTVRDRVSVLLAKFEARSRAELIAKVIDWHRHHHRRLLG